MDPKDMLSQFAGSLPPPLVAGQSESAASIPAQNEEDFGTIKAYFDNADDLHMRGIGKLYDHMVKLYSDGGKRLPLYQGVLKTIKAIFSPETDYAGDCYDDPSRLEDAEMMLMRIATDKTKNETERRHQLQNPNSNHKHNIVGMGEKLPHYYAFFTFPDDEEDCRRKEMAWRVLFHHVVKMDEGYCSTQYKSVLVSFSDTFFSDGDKRMDEVVRKLDEIEKGKGIGSTEDMIVDNATTDLQNEDEDEDVDEQASRIMQWAMSDRLIIQEIHFREERDSVLRATYDGFYGPINPFNVLEVLCDHIEELDGGQCRYMYIKAFRKLLKQICSQNDTQADNFIDGVEAVFKEIAIQKMGETRYQEVSESVEERMRYYHMELFEGNLYDEDDRHRPGEHRKLELLAKQIPVICRHLLILDDSDCSVQYKKAFERIKCIYVTTFQEMNLFNVPVKVSREARELQKRNLDSLRNTLKEVGEKKNINNISKRKENLVAATAGDTEEDSSSYMVPQRRDADVRRVLPSRHKWVDSSEILDILQNFESFQMSKEVQQKPPSGSLILYNTKALRFYKKDGYNWQKQKDGKTVTEGHMILKVGGHKKLHCYYAHSIDDEKIQRRTYSLLNKSSSIRLVHYLDVNSEDNNKSENFGREVEDKALEVGHDSAIRMKSSDTSSWTKKRLRRESDGDDMNKEIDNQILFPQKGNRAISTNTPSLVNEMEQLAKEVESLPGFDRKSDSFFSAMESFMDEKKMALFRAMRDRDSKVRMLKKILKL